VVIVFDFCVRLTPPKRQMSLLSRRR
jgi:hypothetical protein